MPLRSPGCYACRKRKIRCDLARPGCQRCATHGVTCPGYRDETIEWKDQTDVTVFRAKGWKIRGRGAEGGRSGKVERDGEGLTGEWSTSTKFSDDWTTSACPSATAVAVSPRASFSVYGSSNTYRPPVPTISPIALPSPALERTALYQSFIDTYLPRQTLHGIQEGHFSFLQTLALQRSAQPALQSGFDALSLVQIGSTFHSPELLQQARRQYARALSALGASISSQNFLHSDEVLAAIVVLSHCELYEDIQVAGQGWSAHVAASNQLVAARGPASLQSDLALLLYANMRHGSMCHALIERKAPFMARREWRDVAWRVPLKKDQSTLFYEWGIRVPGLLERHDKLDLDESGALEEVVALLEESEEIERELKAWFADWEAIAAVRFGGLSELVPITEFPTFLGLSGDDAFDEALQFPDFLICYLQTMYWMTMHFLRHNTQSLHKKRHQLQRDWYPDPDDDVQEEELLGYILNLCRSIPYCCEPGSSSMGSIVIFLPMRTAAMYFTAHGHWRLLKWIGSVRGNVFVRGLRPPSVDGKLVQGRKASLSSSAGSSPNG